MKVGPRFINANNKAFNYAFWSTAGSNWFVLFSVHPLTPVEGNLTGVLSRGLAKTWEHYKVCEYPFLVGVFVCYLRRCERPGASNRRYSLVQLLLHNQAAVWVGVLLLITTH